MERKSFMVAIVAIIAVILVGAGVYALANNGNNPDPTPGPEPTPSTYNYSILYEVVGDNGVVQKFDTISFTTESKTIEAYVAAANKALDGTGIVMSDTGWITYNGSGNNATYVSIDGQWAVVSTPSEEYVANESVAFMVGNGYISTEVYNALSDEEKAGYKSTGYGGAYAYMKLVDSEFKHGIYYEVIGDDGRATDFGTVTFTVTDLSLETFMSSANKALEGTGITFESSKYGASVKLNGGGDNRTYYFLGEGWMEVKSTSNDYRTSAAVALMLGNGYISTEVYNALSDEEKAGYNSTGYGDPYAYTKLVDELVDYFIYYEVIGDDGRATSSDIVAFSAPRALATYVSAANKALEGTGITITIGSFVSVKYNGSGGSATYYLDNGEWTKVTSTTTQYHGNESVAFMVGNGYISAEVYNALSDEEKAGYMKSGMTGDWEYMKLPDTVSRTVYYEVIGDDGKVVETSSVSFITFATLDSYMLSANAALEGTGITFEPSKYGASVKYNGSTNSATYYLSDGEWVQVSKTATQYCGNESVALMVGNGYISADVYNALSDEEKAGYNFTGYGGDYDYMKLPDISA